MKLNMKDRIVEKHVDQLRLYEHLLLLTILKPHSPHFVFAWLEYTHEFNFEASSINQSEFLRSANFGVIPKLTFYKVFTHNVQAPILNNFTHALSLTWFDILLIFWKHMQHSDHSCSSFMPSQILLISTSIHL